jgi:hypothetical protein
MMACHACHDDELRTTASVLLRVSLSSPLKLVCFASTSPFSASSAAAEGGAVAGAAPPALTLHGARGGSISCSCWYGSISGAVFASRRGTCTFCVR